MAAVHSAPIKSGPVHVIEVSRSDLIADVTAAVGRSGLTLERFVELGRRGELRDDGLRDLWLMAGPAFD